MRITSPPNNASISLSAEGMLPPVIVQTDGQGVHQWEWEISWGNYRRSGRSQSPGPRWDATALLADLGGTLKLKVTAGSNKAETSIKITGTNPTSNQVQAYLTSRPNSDGFFRIVNHETQCRHFNAQGEPIRSFDNGFGMAQLTNPAPSYEQVWSWKRNIDGGLMLFAEKRRAAAAYLSRDGRTYNADQLRRETISRWNGGAYHTWNQAARVWERNPNIVCDASTGNIGWDMTDPTNAGMGVDKLRSRDGGQFRTARPTGAHWRYFGVCYADRIAD